eukprot:CAMPEP_0201545440 /NCGR_PEP_ID=MMETSP0173_2-20130828/1962_1 /ASSEMBLY_ACC=CAM_ASM_000268 /TAXON_ID=218659 /ORGANISM="Vexillifera sp., Strain DIVA3 564/2" /LENGTH=465 /DNA_ID=CAMNT_0047953845 /DNA_START=339 /DNA_END=1733 /DNA_ORIENTATION=-
MKISQHLFSFVLVLICGVIASTCASFHERLDVSMLSSEHSLLTFEFTLDTLPNSLQSVVSKYDVAELHFALTKGRWQRATWGAPAALLRSPPAGSELFLWMHKKSALKELSHALSGMFCASVHLMSTYTMPVSARFERMMAASVNQKEPIDDDMQFFYTQPLPREAVCTENLTPLIKLLPGAARGRNLAALLSRHQKPLWKSTYHSLQLDYVQGSATIRALFVLPSDSSLLDNDAALFVPSLPYPYEFEFLQDTYKPLASPPIDVSRKLVHKGDQHGSFLVRFAPTNTTLQLDYVEYLPWYLKVYFHTFQMTRMCGNEKPQVILPHHLAVQPPLDREAFGYLQFGVDNIEPGCVLYASFDFDKAFLSWTEFPPDAHQGESVGASMVQVRDTNGQRNLFYTQPLLITLPTPDFSMPYNVITLTSTILALFFGTMYNLLIKRQHYLKTAQEDRAVRPIVKIMRAIQK